MQDYPEKRFFSTITEFVESLRVTFPDEPNIVNWKIKRNSKSIRDIVSLLDPHANSIRDMNMALFERPRELLPGLDFSILMNKSDVTEDTRMSIWQYLQMVLLLGKFIVKPKEAMQTDLLTGLMEAMENSAEQASKATKKDNSSQPSKDKTHTQNNKKDETSDVSIFESLANDLAEEIKLPEDVSGDNPIQMIQSMLNSGGLMDMISKVGEKLSSKVNDGQINEDMLKNEAQKMFGKMSELSKDTPGMPDLSKTLQPLMNMMQGGQPPDPKAIFQMLGSTIGSLQGSAAGGQLGDHSSGQPDIMNMISTMMGGNGEELPDLDELQKTISKDMRKQFREQNQELRTNKKRGVLQNRLQSRQHTRLLENGPSTSKQSAKGDLSQQ